MQSQIPELLTEALLEAAADCRAKCIDATEQELSESPRWQPLRSRILKYFGDRGLEGRLREIVADLEGRE
jgi:hypothetical protein